MALVTSLLPVDLGGAAQNEELQVSRARTEFARRSFLCRAKRAWSQLSAGVRGAPILRVFTTTLDD